ncbi:hypothetical protein ACH3VR_16310 [Microbacterium sp. B2969]|uniref:Uncharacterized protein n=1 Tax=Microbacterium alkaliflavum TaxID=3248839 RepID=A0ABW7QAQ0_9MICO
MRESDEQLVKAVIAKYGTTLDLVNRPDELIEIVRNIRFDDPDGGTNPCAGTPPPPPPGPGPTSLQFGDLQLVDVMKEVFALRKAVDQNTKQLKSLRKGLTS